MFHVPMGRFQLESKLELPLFYIFIFIFVPSIICVRSCSPFVVLTTSSADLVGCRSFFCRPAWAVDRQAYRSEFIGTTVKPENKGNSNFDSNLNIQE